MSANCNFESSPLIRAPYPHVEATICNTTGFPEAGVSSPRQSLDTSSGIPLPSRSEGTDFAKSSYIGSLQNQCEGLHLPWKAGFSFSNHYLWAQTLKYAVLELLQDERSQTDRQINEEGVDQFAELVESAIFHFIARDPSEYGNSMAAKYDSIRYGDFSKEERSLLQHFAWL